MIPLSTRAVRSWPKTSSSAPASTRRNRGSRASMRSRTCSCRGTSRSPRSPATTPTRYMYDRVGGDAAMHRLYADLSPPPSSTANLHPLVAEAGNGETFAQLYAEFAAALAARNVASSDPRFTFGSNVLLNGLTTITFAGGTTFNERFDGPRSPEDLASTTPETLPRIKLTPGATVSAKLISGATLFFNSAKSGGSIVRLNSATAPGGTVDGALVQGGYDDNGACLGPPSSCT